MHHNQRSTKQNRDQSSHAEQSCKKASDKQRS
jgi:hypothetical protein